MAKERQGTLKGRALAKRLVANSVSSNRELAESIGISPQLLWNYLNNGNNHDLPVDILGDIVARLGYKVVVIPKEEPVSSNWFVVS